MKASKHLYDHIVYDSTNERDFAKDLDTNNSVAVYVKLPDGFYISTPVGHYNPDWAIAFHEGAVKHIYFVAETKGSMSSMQLRLIEESKIHCAREHFRAISGDNVVYDVVDSYTSLLEKVMRYLFACPAAFSTLLSPPTSILPLLLLRVPTFFDKLKRGMRLIAACLAPLSSMSVLLSPKEEAYKKRPRRGGKHALTPPALLPAAFLGPGTGARDLWASLHDPSCRTGGSC